MLVLTRMVNEDILIGDDIIVEVLEIRGDRVSIGVRAPDNVSIDRREIRKLKDADMKTSN